MNDQSARSATRRRVLEIMDDDGCYLEGEVTKQENILLRVIGEDDRAETVILKRDMALGLLRWLADQGVSLPSREDGECRSCVNGQCVTGPECVSVSTPPSQSAEPVRITEVVGQDGSPVAAPCAISGCQYSRLVASSTEAKHGRLTCEEVERNYSQCIESHEIYENAYRAFRDLAVWGETEYKPINDEDRELALATYRLAYAPSAIAFDVQTMIDLLTRKGYAWHAENVKHAYSIYLAEANATDRRSDHG